MCPKCVVSSAIEHSRELTKGYIDHLYSFRSHFDYAVQFFERFLATGTGVVLVYGSCGDHCQLSGFTSFKNMYVYERVCIQVHLCVECIILGKAKIM